jgi:hypothetical protein
MEWLMNMMLSARLSVSHWSLFTICRRGGSECILVFPKGRRTHTGLLTLWRTTITDVRFYSTVWLHTLIERELLHLQRDSFTDIVVKFELGSGEAKRTMLTLLFSIIYRWRELPGRCMPTRELHWWRGHIHLRVWSWMGWGQLWQQ